MSSNFHTLQPYEPVTASGLALTVLFCNLSTLFFFHVDKNIRGCNSLIFDALWYPVFLITMTRFF